MLRARSHEHPRALICINASLMLAFRRAWRLLRTACRRAAGTSVLLDPEVVDAARPVIEAAPYPIERIVRVAGAINPARDTYC